MVDTWTQVTGKKVTYAAVPPGTSWAGLPIEYTQTMSNFSNLMEGDSFFGLTGAENLDWMLAQLKEGEKLTTWKEFVKANEPWF